MKFNLLILLAFLLTSCNTTTLKKKISVPYKSTGFALIYNELDYKNGNISGKLNNSEFQIAHPNLKKNSIVQILNPENNKSLTVKVTKKINYPNFFNILISQKVSDELDLNTNHPYVDINHILKNKSFVAKKAVTHSEEQKVSDKAPVTLVKIDNISKDKTRSLKKTKTFYIVIGVFYSKEATNELKDILEGSYVDKNSLVVNKLGNNKFQLSTKKHSSINTLKNLYFGLNKYGFEYLDIKQNDKN
tara:strand:+ start:227 stop:964 length:738 start_codon:yes stop_codon:yes gene_type:complete